MVALGSLFFIHISCSSFKNVSKTIYVPMNQRFSKLQKTLFRSLETVFLPSRFFDLSKQKLHALKIEVVLQTIQFSIIC